MRPLFCRDSLLAFERTGNGAIVQEFGIEDGRLEPRYVLLSDLKRSSDVCWCVVNGSLLAAWNIESGALTFALYTL